MGTLTGGIVGSWLINAFYGILLTIDYVIYLAINLCYQLFEVVSKVEVFTTENVGIISRRIYTIIGIVMLFVFAYNIILGIVDPDSLNKGDKSVQNIVKNTVISVVLITLFPLICEYMQTFQDHIVENNTIGNLIMGSTVSDTGENGSGKGALNVSTTIFTAFYHPLNENGEAVTLTECESSSAKLCPRYKELADKSKNSIVDLHNFMQDSDLKNGIAEDNMEYLFPLSTIAGVVAAYLFLSFSLDLGVRAAKLGALKLIAPIPIFLRITKPKGGSFDKWFSEFTKTYLQVFERIIIINFAMLLISFVSDVNIFATDGNFLINVIATVVVILGILKFAKDAPKLIEDIFSVKIPQMSLKKKINDNEYALRGASMLGGAGATAVGNVIKGIREGKGFGGVLKTGLGGLIGGGRQGWIQSRGLNDVSKLKDTIVGARATADEHRDDREASSRGLAGNWLDKQIKQIKLEHPEWSDAQVEQYVEENKLRERAEWHGTVIDRTADRALNTGKEFVEYMTSGGDAILQRSYANQKKLKDRANDFIKNYINKNDYEKTKASMDKFVDEAGQGKISARELATRLTQISGKSASIIGMSVEVDGQKHKFNTIQEKINTIKNAYGIDLDEQIEKETNEKDENGNPITKKVYKYNDLRENIEKGKINNTQLLETLENLTGKQGDISADGFILDSENFDREKYDLNTEEGRKKAIDDGLLYDINTKKGREDAIKSAYKEMLDAAQIKNLKDLGSDVCANNANNLAKEFGELSLTIDNEKVRNELSDMIEKLVDKSKHLERDADYLEFAQTYDKINKKLKKSSDDTFSNLLNVKNKKDGK